MFRASAMPQISAEVVAERCNGDRVPEQKLGWLAFTSGIISKRRLLNSLPGRDGDDILTKDEALEGS
jgi:hypothetical protein